MSDFVEATISRSSLSLAPLHLSSDTGYFIQRGGLGPGALQHARSHASSIYVNGDFLVQKRKEMMMVEMVVRVEGVNPSQLHSKIQELTEAVDQYRFTLSVEIDGVVYEWTCEAADWTVGDSGAWDDMMLRSLMQYVSLEIPRFPD